MLEFLPFHRLTGPYEERKVAGKDAGTTLRGMHLKFQTDPRLENGASCSGITGFGTVPFHVPATLFQPMEMGMTIPQELLDILVCPLCKTPVKPLANDSGLECSSCRRVYPIKDEIPVMLPEEATVASE